MDAIDLAQRGLHELLEKHSLRLTKVSNTLDNLGVAPERILAEALVSHGVQAGEGRIGSAAGMGATAVQVRDSDLYVRSLAVTLVDNAHKTTVEHASNPSQHRAFYDRVEADLKVAMQVNRFRLVKD